MGISVVSEAARTLMLPSSIMKRIALLGLLTIAACSAPAEAPEGRGSKTSHIDGNNRASPEEIARAAHTAGVSCDQLGVAVAIALGESSGIVTASHVNAGGSIDRGVWQINSIHGKSEACLFDLDCNAAAMFDISSGGTNWRPWAVYTGGRYLDFLGEGNAAASSECNGGGGGRGAAPAPAPFVEAPRPASDPFPALHVRERIGSDVFITQCSREGDANRVWQTNGTGPDPATSWAPAKYPEENKLSCGDAGPDGMHPLVFRSLEAGQLGGAWIVQCSGFGDQAQHVFHVDAEVDGHPAASFLYNEPNPDCD
jgi:hypothetical protein